MIVTQCRPHAARFCDPVSDLTRPLSYGSRTLCLLPCDAHRSQSAACAIGKGIPAQYRGAGPAAVGGSKALLFGDIQKIGYEIYKDELAQCVPPRARTKDSVTLPTCV